MGWRIICLFINLFVCCFAIAQHVTPQQGYANDNPEKNIGLPLSFNSTHLADTTTTVKYAPFIFMASNYYTSSLGFFCKKELEVEKTLKFPLKFRLGSVEYTDRMEGKGAGFFKRQ